jgi:RES domain-containing protein
MTTSRWLKLLATCPTIPWDASLSRCVHKSAYEKGKPPNYLFTSETRNRCNPQGVLCIYMAEEQETALVEFNKYALKSVPEPFIVYSGHLKAARIVDLADPAICGRLGITEDHLFKPFRLRKSPTRLESLGLAISTQQGIVGIRFPSAAARSEARTGHNLVIFKVSLVTPDYLEIEDPHTTNPARWP